MVLLFRSTSMKIIFYFLLGKQICLCMAIGFAAFSFQTLFVEISLLIFVKKAIITNFLLNVSRTHFSMRFCCTRVQHDVTNWKTVQNIRKSDSNAILSHMQKCAFSKKFQSF